MKILQIGCGGGGSWLVPEICECIAQGQISYDTELTIADGDMIEMEQVKPRGFHNFNIKDVGENKAGNLAKRYKEFGIKAIPKMIRKEAELKGYDVILLCVDNEKTREMVIRYCHRHDKEFLDLRATGRRIFVMPKEKKLEDNLKFVESKDLKHYSCQDKADLDKGYIQKVHKIVALWGVQMLLNLLRGHDNYIFTRMV